MTGTGAQILFTNLVKRVAVKNKGKKHEQYDVNLRTTQDHPDGCRDRKGHFKQHTRDNMCDDIPSQMLISCVSIERRKMKNLC